VTVADGEHTDVASRTVYVARNAPPFVRIGDPGEVEPGESVILPLAEL
jgi:hypothetical protein